MISKPTTAQLIEVACSELDAKVGPAVPDGPIKVVLDMVVAVLRSAAVRTANELAWMREEAGAIEAVAHRIVAESPDCDRLVQALRTYGERKTDSWYLEDAEADYERASEMLSCATDIASATGKPAHLAAIHDLFEQRMTHENAITGGFQAVGRT